MATAEMDYVNRGGGVKYYTPSSTITPNTSAFTNIKCNFAPKYVVLYFIYGGTTPWVVFWDVESTASDAILLTNQNGLDGASYNTWSPYLKIGDDGISIDYKAPNANLVLATRVRIFG